MDRFAQGIESVEAICAREIAEGRVRGLKTVITMKKRKRRAKWYLLYRREDGQAVYRYEPLQKCELNSRIRKGWKVVQ